MTTHLKSRNGSWNLDDLKTKNLYFSKPLFEILQDKDGRTFIRENGKKVRSKIDIIDLIDKETSSGRFACGYFSYEYNSKVTKPSKYNAIFNIYEGFSPCGKNKISYQTSKRILKKVTPNSNFISGVKKAQKYIKDGDIYQINLTREFTLGKIKSPYELFLNYYQTQPVDFGSFFEFHDHSIVSGSMELFIKKSGLWFNFTYFKAKVRLYIYYFSYFIIGNFLNYFCLRMRSICKSFINNHFIF